MIPIMFIIVQCRLSLIDCFYCPILYYSMIAINSIKKALRLYGEDCDALSEIFTIPS